MVVSVGPSNTALSTLSGTQRTQKEFSQRTSETQSGFKPASVTVRSSLVEQRSEAAPEIAPRTLAEERTSNVLFRASSEVRQRTEATQTLELRLSEALSFAKRAEKEVDVGRRQELEDEANNLLSQAQEDFNQLLSQTPSLDQAVQVSAVLDPAAAASGGPGTFEIGIAAAPSPTSIGLASVSFADPEQAASEISAARDSVRQLGSQFTGNAVQLSQVVSTQIQKAEVQNPDGSTRNPEQFASQIAGAIRTFASTETQAIERLDVQNLLSEAEEGEQARAADNQRRTESSFSPIEVGGDNSASSQQAQQSAQIRIF